ncbi:NAD-dependent epimerase/dehydratase family protein [Streptomyces lavendofoliae]|uniref:NAD-dependent epimerase/dehydratase family protein n=1 Tax=Streptomyces lavendofoliae TaxID=67314 RepID=UPI003D907D1F
MVQAKGDAVSLGTVAITAAAGTIGCVAREALRGEADRLILLDRVPLRREAENEDVHTVDLRDAAAVESALAGADRVLHLGGPTRHLSPSSSKPTCSAPTTSWRLPGAQTSSGWCWPAAIVDRLLPD